jgi:hypothetical protein
MVAGKYGNLVGLTGKTVDSRWSVVVGQFNVNGFNAEDAWVR